MELQCINSSQNINKQPNATIKTTERDVMKVISNFIGNRLAILVM